MMMMVAKFKLGNLVRVCPLNPERRYVLGRYTLTTSERDALKQDPYFRGLDDANVPRTVPDSGLIRLEPGSLVTVIRTRIRPPVAWVCAKGCYVLVCSPATGREVYIREVYLEPLEQNL